MLCVNGLPEDAPKIVLKRVSFIQVIDAMHAVEQKYLSGAVLVEKPNHNDSMCSLKDCVVRRCRNTGIHALPAARSSFVLRAIWRAYLANLLHLGTVPSQNSFGDNLPVYPQDQSMRPFRYFDETPRPMKFAPKQYMNTEFPESRKPLFVQATLSPI